MRASASSRRSRDGRGLSIGGFDAEARAADWSGVEEPEAEEPGAGAGACANAGAVTNVTAVASTRRRLRYKFPAWRMWPPFGVSMLFLRLSPPSSESSAPECVEIRVRCW